MKRKNSRRAPAPTSLSVPPPRPEPASGVRLTAAAVPLDTIELAAALIGKLLVRVREGERIIGRIVETEAYLPDDPSSHAFRGITPRNSAMFGPPLHAYVYFVYGANWCLNITADQDGVGAAVLVRACVPLAGLATMRALRGRDSIPDRDLARGPGNLCRALGIGPELNGVDLATSAELWLADDGTRVPVGTSPRIGLTRAVEVPHRFYARGNPSVSGPRALSP